MSDNFVMLVDEVATLAEAQDLADAVVLRLRQKGLIAGEATPDHVLRGVGYQPGPAVPKLYCPADDEGTFWELVTCGVEPCVGRNFNVWALAEVCEGFTCPSCSTFFEYCKEFGDSLGAAFQQWYDESGDAILRCPRCSKGISITEWRCNPPLGFGNLAFRFWNWPPFEWPAWKIDIVALVREATGHPILSTYGRV